MQSCNAEGVTVGQDPISTASDIARSEVAMGVGGENKELWDMGIQQTTRQSKENGGSSIMIQGDDLVQEHIDRRKLRVHVPYPASYTFKQPQTHPDFNLIDFSKLNRKYLSYKA